MGDIGGILASAGIMRSSSSDVAPLAATFLNRTAATRLVARSGGGQGMGGAHRVTQYARVPFTSSARQDGLTLRHWRRATTAKGADYEFAKFNHETRIVQYSDEEWNVCGLGNADLPSSSSSSSPASNATDPDGHLWTREETDRLFNLCRIYALRWPVIADRFNSGDSDGNRRGANAGKTDDKGHTRLRFGSLEQLKHRYYSIAKAVLNYRYSKETKTGPAPARVDAEFDSVTVTAGALSESTNSTSSSGNKRSKSSSSSVSSSSSSSPSAGTGAPGKVTVSVLQPGPVEAKMIMAFDYDLHAERERLSYLQTMLSRKRSVDDEENRLKAELKRIELQMKKLSDDSTLMLATTQSRMASTMRGRPSILAQPFGRTVGGAGTVGTSSVRAATTHASAAGRGALGSVTTRLPAANFGPLLVDAPIYLRSVRLESESTEATFSVNTKMLQKMHMVLQELGVPARPIPTKRVCDAYDQIRRDILTILAAKKHVLPKHRAKAQANADAREAAVQAQHLKDAKAVATAAQNRAKAVSLFRDRVSNPLAGSSGPVAVKFGGTGKVAKATKLSRGRGKGERGRGRGRGRGAGKSTRGGRGEKTRRKRGPSKKTASAAAMAVATAAEKLDAGDVAPAGGGLGGDTSGAPAVVTENGVSSTAASTKVTTSRRKRSASRDAAAASGAAPKKRVKK